MLSILRSRSLLYASFRCTGSSGWNCLISEKGYGEVSSKTAALGESSYLFHSDYEPNSYDFRHLISVCAYSGLFCAGEQLHCHVLKTGLNSNAFVSTALINFYVKFELLHNAHQVFVEIPEPSLVSWNSVISGYVRCGRFRRALELFDQLEKSSLRADAYSITAVLSVCGQLKLFTLGRTLHSRSSKLGYGCSTFVANCLIDMYGKCGYAAEASTIFESMPAKDTISWNSFLSANARNGKLDLAFDIFHQMPNPDTIAYNELISSIAQFGLIDDAISLLARTPNPDSSSWNSIISGYVNRNRATEALEFFCRMHCANVAMDEFTFSSILSGIASLSAIIPGDLTHCYVIKIGLNCHVIVGTALLDMYFKCGKISEAETVFQSLPEKNLVTWNSMISGYANNGDSTKAIELFHELESMKNGPKPDEITFLNVLLSCWNNKMIPLRIASAYFEMMLSEYTITPMPEHCSLMIKLMGREGDLSNAVKMIHELGHQECGTVWETLLGACVVCGDMKVAEIAASKSIELGVDNKFTYVSLSNVYAGHGKWEDVGWIRRLMKKMKLRKECGCSWIQVEDSLPIFT